MPAMPAPSLSGARPRGSSDGWMGDVPASNGTFGLAFRGNRIVAAVIQALVQLQVSERLL